MNASVRFPGRRRQLRLMTGVLAAALILPAVVSSVLLVQGTRDADARRRASEARLLERQAQEGRATRAELRVEAERLADLVRDQRSPPPPVTSVVIVRTESPPGRARPSPRSTATVTASPSPSETPFVCVRGVACIGEPLQITREELPPAAGPRAGVAVAFGALGLILYRTRRT